MSQSKIGLEADKEFILQMLNLEVTRETHPDEFDDDGVWMTVCRVAGSDPEWMLGKLADPSYPRAGRETVGGFCWPIAEKVGALFREMDGTERGKGR